MIRGLSALVTVLVVVLGVNSLVAVVRGLSRAPGELLMWGPLAVATAAATAVLLTRVPHRERRKEPA